MRLRGLLTFLAWAVVAAALGDAAGADVVLQTRNLRLQIAADGTLKSLAAKPSGAEYLWVADPGPIAMVYRGGQMAVGSQEDFVEDEAPRYRGGQAFRATAAALEGDRLTLRFAGANVAATCQVTQTAHYLALRLVSLEGEPIDRIDFVQLRLRRLPHLGPWINVAYDERFGVCLCAGNIRTNAGMNRHERYVEMRAIATREVAFEGAAAVLFGCHDPKETFLDAMEIVERDFQMPAGARHRRSPLQDYSYLWCRPTPADVDQYIALAKRAGLRMILYSYTSFTEGAGHFVFNARFPGGMADLKQVADAIRAAGLRLGLHIHYTKAVKNDAYVTPLPDPRLHKTRSFTLAAPVNDQATTIAVNEDPAGCTLAEGRRILQVGKELIAYQDYRTRPPAEKGTGPICRNGPSGASHKLDLSPFPYQFTGCERGHLKTARAAHRAGEAVGLLDVDDWHIFVRFDQNTDIQDEVARRIAEIFNQTGPYDMLYFDGAEDVHDPFWHHVANAQHRVFRLLDPPPPVCEAAMSSHFSWHMLSRGNAYDVPEKHIKSFCREVSCRTAPVRAADFTRINFGWIFGFYAHLGPDVLEYVLSRGAAWDCPFSIIASPQQVAANPRADDCLEVIKTWEEARIGRRLSLAQKTMLRTLDPGQHAFIKTWHAVFVPRWVDAWSKGRFQDQEHHLFVNERGQHELVPVTEIPDLCAGQLRAYAFQREGRPADTYVLLWTRRGEAKLRLPVPADRLRLMRPFGVALRVESEDGEAVVPVGSRRYLVLPETTPTRCREMLGRARLFATAP